MTYTDDDLNFTNRYFIIPHQIIASSVKWVLQHQSYYGAFYEITWLPDRKMNSSTDWPENNRVYTTPNYYRQQTYEEDIKFRNLSLTAHVLIMLETVKDLTSVSCTN